jgi:hypothetical protein
MRGPRRFALAAARFRAIPLASWDRWSTDRGATFAAGPMPWRTPTPIIADMQNVTPIRRYVLLRHRDRAATASRWSMERIGSAPRAGAAPAASRRRAADAR